VLVAEVQRAFGADGEPVNKMMRVALDILLDDLTWWSSALADARARGQLPPGSVRLRAARAAS